MKKIKYIKRPGEICAYFDKSLFDSESHEKKFLINILRQVLQAEFFEGKVILNYSDRNIVSKFKKNSIQCEDIVIKKIFTKNIILKISFDLKNLEEIIDLIYENDTSLEGIAICKDSSKIEIVLNDHDGSCIIFNNSSKKLESYKELFLNEMNK